MNTRLAAIRRRREVLVEEIAGQREAMAALVVNLRSQLAIAGLALLAGRLLRRSRWLRLLAVGGTGLAAVLPLLSRLVSSRPALRPRAP